MHGTRDATESLAEYCNRLEGVKIITPNIGEIVDATRESHIYQV